MKLKHALILSLLLHTLLFLGLKVVFYEAQKDEPTEREWLELKDQENAPLMSDSNKRVDKQTRIKETSPATLSALSKPTPAAPMQAPKKAQEQADQQQTKGSTLGEALRTESRESGDMMFNPHGGSAVTQQVRQRLQSFLPRDLEIGDVVALNTDQNLFFTFYSRMAEKVIWPWAQNVMAGFESLRAQGQLGGTRKAWVTVVEVLLDKNGSLVSIQPMQLSGTSEIDAAPTKAFSQARNFPNPPQEMIEEDGYIHIRYKFMVYYTPRPNF